MQLFNHVHFDMFSGDLPATWVRMRRGVVDASVFDPANDFSVSGIIEMCASLIVPPKDVKALFPVAIEASIPIGETARVFVYYYEMGDAGNTGGDPEYIGATHQEERVVPLPDWFPCQNARPGLTP